MSHPQSHISCHLNFPLLPSSRAYSPVTVFAVLYLPFAPEDLTKEDSGDSPLASDCAQLQDSSCCSSWLLVRVLLLLWLLRLLNNFLALASKTLRLRFDFRRSNSIGSSAHLHQPCQPFSLFTPTSSSSSPFSSLPVPVSRPSPLPDLSPSLSLLPHPLLSFVRARLGRFRISASPQSLSLPFLSFASPLPLPTWHSPSR